MKHWLSLLLWLPLAVLAAPAPPALPHLDLDVQLDPASRQFNATATLTDEQALTGFRLGAEFEITAMTVNGQSMKPVRRPTSADVDGPPRSQPRLAAPHGGANVGLGRPGADFRLPAGARRVVIAYRATLAATPHLDHRQVLGQRAGTASPDGSFLPGAAGWYPETGKLFSYRLVLRLPAGQKGLVPGNLVQESATAAGFRAEFEFPYPADSIDLMAGPYTVSERSLRLTDGGTIRVRTWFHDELAGLAEGYLDDSARYLERYSKLIGAYPFDIFSVVSSPTPTGFGMPSLTYLGREVIRLPFIRATSLGHEVLHNWWGNGVYPDWQKGNWSEGLTTFLADYAYKEDEGAEAAREMRLAWLRDLAAIPAGADIALKDFTARHHGISSIVGYNKAAMVFLMLEDEIGRDAFLRGLRLLWQRKQFQTASWSDLEVAFATASGQSLSVFFRQWVGRPGAPEIRLKSAERSANQLTVQLAQSGDHALTLPLRLVYPERTEMRRVRLGGRETSVVLDGIDATLEAVEVDPDYRLWRRIAPALLPPILREVFVALGAQVVAADADAAVRAAALALAARVLDAKPPAVGAEWPAAGAVLLVGLDPSIDAWLARLGLPARPASNRGSGGTAQVWAGRDPAGRPYVVIAARDAAALKALERGLPHYGRQSWLVFEGARMAEKGVWPPQAERVPVNAAPARRADPPARRRPV
ncbi:MAG: M1 family aminopeptidase [Rhodocyclaceae bacterium]|nr:M1 family aminopeptidase [Rhodocyclaceae bacterium]